MLPLVLVLAVSLAKEGFEDRKRAAKDKEVYFPFSFSFLAQHSVQTNQEDARAASLSIFKEFAHRGQGHEERSSRLYIAFRLRLAALEQKRHSTPSCIPLPAAFFLGYCLCIS